MKYILHYLLLLLLLPVTGFAKTDDPAGGMGIIKGQVTTNDNKPAADVTIYLKGITTVTTGDNGTFVIKVAPGDYDLQVSLTGYETVSREVTVTENEVTNVNLQLRLSRKELREVVVTSGRMKFRKQNSEFVAKTPLTNLENPQVYTTIGKELLADQLVFSVDDAMKNAPGLTKMWEATGRSGDGGSYYNARGFIMQSQLRNGVAGNVTSKIDAANLERIDVIKGPSATLFGSILTSYGGLINRVTKKPYDHLGGEFTIAAGNYGFSRVSADVNTPLDAAKNVLLRINTAYNYDGTFQDNGFNKSFVFAPSLSYKVNDRLSFLFDAEIYAGRNFVSPIFFFPYGQTIASLGTNRADKLPIDYNRSFTSDDLSQKSMNSNFFGQMNYRISRRWSTQTNVTVTNSYSDGTGVYFYILSNAAVTGNPNAAGADYISRNDQFTANSTDRMIELQQNLNGEFNIGRVKNRFLAGLDFFSHNSDQFFSGGTLDTIKSHGEIPTYRNFNRNSLSELYETKGVDFVYPVKNNTNTYSVYASDVANLTDRLMVLAAIRADHFVNFGNYDITTGTVSGNYDQTTLSPKLGVVFQPVKDKVSLFANYQNGFTNKNGTAFDGTAFKPEQANQMEGGVKVDVFGGKLGATVSYYYIKVKDVVRPYAANPLFSVQDGTQVSKGFEAEVSANPFRGMSIIAGFSYNDSKYEKADADVEGRRPGTAGAPYSANLWMSYRLPDHVVKGLGFGLGGNYVSDNKIINSVSVGEFTLPAYTILNASAFYDCGKFRFGVKMDNITNQKYWIGYTTMSPQKLRSFAGSISFRF